MDGLTNRRDRPAKVIADNQMDQQRWEMGDGRKKKKKDFFYVSKFGARSVQRAENDNGGYLWFSTYFQYSSNPNRHNFPIT